MFAIPFKYRDSSQPWPRSTILLYKYSSNSPKKCAEIPENTWRREDNAYQQKHAESKMICALSIIQNSMEEERQEVANKEPIGINSIEVILSYSPCIECSKDLCLFKDKLDVDLRQRKTTKVINTAEDEKIQFKITFSNFYKHFELGYMDGLEDLLKKGIKLDILTDDNWEYFFNASGLVTDRQRRERDDKKLLHHLKESVTLDKLKKTHEESKISLYKQNLMDRPQY